jgi:RHS repeat-associated protein
VTRGTKGLGDSYDVGAADPHADPLTYGLVVAPAGMSIDPSTGLVGWVPGAPGAFDVTVSVDDGRGGTAKQSFTIDVDEIAAPNIPPVANGGVDQKETEATIYFVHSDHLGAPQRLSDESGSVVWAVEYEPFGQISSLIATVSNNLRFPGQYFDEETGLHYNYFRDYIPVIGRYLQSDPIGLRGGHNTYAYVRGNPIRFSDRLGLEDVIDAVSLGISVPTGPIAFGIGFNLLYLSAQIDTLEGGSASTFTLLPEIGLFFRVCEQPTCDAPEVRRRNPFPVSPDGAGKTSSFSPPALRFFKFMAIEFRPDGTQCFLIVPGIGSPINQTRPVQPLPDLTGTIITSS